VNPFIALAVFPRRRSLKPRHHWKAPGVLRRPVELDPKCLITRDLIDPFENFADTDHECRGECVCHSEIRTVERR
jgi:hypothetical protein